MSEQTADATSIWDERYEKGEHVGSQPVIEGDPIDYTQHKFLYQHAVAKPLTGDLDGWSIDMIARRFLQPPAGRVLALGIGMAFVEEHLVANGYAEHITGYEMSRSAVEAAKARVADKPYADKLELRAGDVLDAEPADALLRRRVRAGGDPPLRPHRRNVRAVAPRAAAGRAADLRRVCRAGPPHIRTARDGHSGRDQRLPGTRLSLGRARQAHARPWCRDRRSSG